MVYQTTQYGQNRGSTKDQDPTSLAAINRLADDAFKKSANALTKAEYGKTTKMFGLFEVDAGLAAFVSTIYNVAADYGSALLRGPAYELTKKLGTKAGLHGDALTKTAAVTTFGLTAALKAGGYVGQIFSSYSAQHKDRIKLAHGLAPVLDDLKGRHSVGALYSVKQSENEVIWAHRQRVAKIEHTTNFNNVINLAVSAGPNLLLDVKNFQGMWQGKSQKQIAEEVAKKNAAAKANAAAGNLSGADEAKHLVHALLNTTTGQIADRLQKSGEHKLRTTLQPYSALEMIRELEEQVASNPKASSFQAPKSFQTPNARADSYPLEEYVMRIFIQHQKDMASFSEEHTEIREALKEDLIAAVKPITQAIRDGNMNITSLIRLVGEGKIIKNRGRAVASADEVETLLEHYTETQIVKVNADPQKYYKDASFTREDLKKVLKSLEGEEKHVFASMLPDSVLEEAGMGATEIKEMRKTIVKSYDKMLADIIIGLHEMSDEELHKDGLAQNEIKNLRKAFTLIEKDGLGALHNLKSGPTNDHGIERLIVNLAVPQLKEDKTYLGPLIQRGRDKFDDVVPERESEETHEPRGKHTAAHEARDAKKEKPSNPTGSFSERHHERDKSHHTERH